MRIRVPTCVTMLVGGASPFMSCGYAPKALRPLLVLRFVHLVCRCAAKGMTASIGAVSPCISCEVAREKALRRLLVVRVLASRA